MSSISIIICFYNAGNKLMPTLQHIKALDISSITACELILVNNNSNDESCNIIMKELQGFTLLPWRIVDEKTPGLSNARLKGIAESQYEYILFCDDDNWLAPDYIQKAIPILKSNRNIAVLGGYGEAVSDIKFPEWFVKYQNFYAVGEQFPHNGRVFGVRNVVYGAGMIVQRKAWEYIVSKGFTFFTLGRTGKSLSSGEDSEMCLAFQIAGFDIWYNNSLRFKHYIEPKRLTITYLQRLQKGMSSSGYVTQFYRRFLFGYTPKITRYFWFKEFLYSIKEILLFTNKNNIKRNIAFALYLIKERNNYNVTVKKIVTLCKELSKKEIGK